MNWVSLVGLYEAASLLPDGGYLATYTAVGVIIVGLVMQTAHSSIYLTAPEISALSCRLCVVKRTPRSSTERPRKLTCRYFRSVGIAGNARQSLLRCNNAN